MIYPPLTTHILAYSYHHILSWRNKTNWSCGWVFLRYPYRNGECVRRSSESYRQGALNIQEERGAAIFECFVVSVHHGSFEAGKSLPCHTVDVCMKDKIRMVGKSFGDVRIRSIHIVVFLGHDQLGSL